jgi:hypothetical protein
MNHEPRLHFFDTCKNAIRTIPVLISDENNPEDIDTRSEDHCLTKDMKVYTTKGIKTIEELIGQDGYCYG